MTDEANEFYEKMEANAREVFTVGSIWVQYPTLPEGSWTTRWCIGIG